MSQSPNVSINNKEFIVKLMTTCVKIRKGCQDGFVNCCICEVDYSVQWADVAITQLHKDKIITKRAKDKILGRLYDGHRG